MIRVCIAGVTGWTGRAVADAVGAADDMELVAGVARSGLGAFPVCRGGPRRGADGRARRLHPRRRRGRTSSALERGVHVVVGSSGLIAEDYAEIDALARERAVGVIAAGNFSP